MESNKKVSSKISKKKKILRFATALRAVSLVIFFLITVALGVLFFILPKKEESALEQRKLASFPEFTFENLWSGDFTSGLNLYYSDNFVFREELVKAKFALEDN